MLLAGGSVVVVGIVVGFVVGILVVGVVVGILVVGFVILDVVVGIAVVFVTGVNVFGTFIVLGVACVSTDDCVGRNVVGLCC